MHITIKLMENTCLRIKQNKKHQNKRKLYKKPEKNKQAKSKKDRNIPGMGSDVIGVAAPLHVS